MPGQHLDIISTISPSPMSNIKLCICICILSAELAHFVIPYITRNWCPGVLPVPHMVLGIQPPYCKHQHTLFHLLRTVRALVYHQCYSCQLSINCISNGKSLHAWLISFVIVIVPVIVPVHAWGIQINAASWEPPLCTLQGSPLICGSFEKGN